MSWLNDFPALGSKLLSEIRRAIDGGFRDFTREHGEALENFFEPLREFLLLSERLLTQTPWPLVIAGIALLTWLASRSLKIAVGTVLTLLLIGVFGMWDDTMKTIAMIFVCTVVALALGLPIGIAMSRFDRLQRWVSPALDVMQTMPSFVYLIPVVMLLGIGRVPGLIAVVIYAIAPVIRFTNLGSGWSTRTCWKRLTPLVPRPGRSCARCSCRWRCRPSWPVSTRPSCCRSRWW